MDKLPWYSSGLQFKCTGCGKCCTGQPGYVWVTKEEIQIIAEHLQISIDLFMRKFIRQKDNRFALIEKKSQNFDCIFLKDKKCEIYQVRPKQCKRYPWWQQNLNTPESWKLASQECEGINDQAPFVPFEEIEKELKGE